MQSRNGEAGIQVLVRVRPVLPRELEFDNAVEVVSDREVVVFKSDAEFASSYQHVFSERTSQEQVYSRVRSGVMSAMRGYNYTVFAYGQTGTGKTYTMMGPPGVDIMAASQKQEQASDEPDLASAPIDGDGPAGAGKRQARQQQQAAIGLVPRALMDLFGAAEKLRKRDGVLVQIAASYMEIYNDRLYDLLQPYKPGSNRDPLDMLQRKALLEVREDKTGATYVPNLLTVKVDSFDAVLQLLAKGNRNRAVRHTEMNMNSSRSHAILQLTMEQWPQGGGSVTRSKVNFVDLAGSERWNKEVDMGQERISELTAINGSLSALASVVAALTEGSRHVPYRDSKLTHLLQDSLGGNCRTTLIAAVSPSVDAFDETVATLKFADRASAIGNNPVVNTSRDLGSVLALKEKEIKRLRQLLASMSAQGGTDNEGGGEAPGSAGGGVMSLLEELESTRRALELERSLRTELELKLQERGPDSIPATPGSEDPHSAGGDAGAMRSGGRGALSGMPPRHPPSSASSSSSPPLGSQRQRHWKHHHHHQQGGGSYEVLQVEEDGEEGSSSGAPGAQRGSSGGAHGRQQQDPFAAVRQRRAQLGLSGGMGPPSPTSSSSASYRDAGYGGLSGRHGSILTPPSPGHQRSSRSNFGLPGQRSALTSPARSSQRLPPGSLTKEGLDEAIARIKQQIQALTRGQAAARASSRSPNQRAPRAGGLSAGGAGMMLRRSASAGIIRPPPGAAGMGASPQQMHRHSFRNIYAPPPPPPHQLLPPGSSGAGAGLSHGGSSRSSGSALVPSAVQPQSDAAGPAADPSLVSLAAGLAGGVSSLSLAPQQPAGEAGARDASPDARAAAAPAPAAPVAWGRAALLRQSVAAASAAGADTAAAGTGPQLSPQRSTSMGPPSPTSPSRNPYAYQLNQLPHSAPAEPTAPLSSVTTPAAASLTATPSFAARSTTDDVPSASLFSFAPPGGGARWGRKALLAAAAAAQGDSPGAAAAATSSPPLQPPQPPSSALSAPERLETGAGTEPAGLGLGGPGSWGRSAITAPTELSASQRLLREQVLRDMMKRSDGGGVGDASEVGSEAASSSPYWRPTVPPAAAGARGLMPSQSQGPTRHASPARTRPQGSPGRMDKGSWIYILGASANSTRAKQLARMAMNPEQM